MRYARPKVLQLDPSRRRRARWQARGVPRFAGLAVACVAVFGGTVAAGLAWPVHGGDAYVDGSRTAQIARVIDGDTVVTADGEHVRILNIDTAEMPPRSRCEAEERLSLAARARLAEMVASGGSVVLASDGGRDRDRYGRQLRLVRINGRDVGDTLIAEGLAQRWRGRKATWC